MKSQYKNFKFNFLIFILFIFFLGVYNLHIKHLVLNDSTISEYLINYQGGFTRRGLIGEICFQFAQYFKFDLRFSIFLIQASIFFTYLALFYSYIKDLPKNILTIIAIFSPAFLLYPLSELEVLARKEMFLFITFIIFLNISNFKFSKNVPLIYIFLVFPIMILIWEPSIFFLPFIAIIILINNNSDSFKKIFLKTFLSFSSSIVVFFYIITHLLSEDAHTLMRNSLYEKFGELCYMSCALLGSKSSIQAQFSAVNELYTLKIIFTYILIIIICFLPLFILLYYSKFKKKIYFLKYSINCLPTLLLLLAPVLILFASATDWGRWVNISYTFSILLYFYLIKNDLIIVNSKILYFDKFYGNRKKLFIFLFFIFAFFWNPKTSMRGDIGTNSLYKIIYNSSKKIIGFNSFRLFQDSPLLKFHKKYID